jgi:hypothetical protein
MKSSESYNFSLFNPRNLHGRKNRNVILTMLLIWVVAVFGFQFLLRGIQRPTPEKTLMLFESSWPAVLAGEETGVDYPSFLRALVLVQGKNSVKPGDQNVISNAISCVTYKMVPDSVKEAIISKIAETGSLKQQIAKARDQEYIDIRNRIVELNRSLAEISQPYSALSPGTLEAAIFTGSLKETCPESFGDSAFDRLPEIMKLHLTHNQSVLTDTPLLGFPFHYFYTAVFLLILFVGLCIVYNILVEWRLGKEGVVE